MCAAQARTCERCKRVAPGRGRELAARWWRVFGGQVLPGGLCEHGARSPRAYQVGGGHSRGVGRRS